MRYMTDILTVTIPTTGLFEAYDLVGFDGAEVVTADAPVLGVAKHPNTVIGDFAGIMTLGTARVRAVGVVTAGSKLVSAVGGVSVAGVDPVNVFATALTAAPDGGLVDILIR